MKKKEIKQKVQEEGYIHTNIMFEVLGNPKEHVENSLKQYLDNLKEIEDITIISEEIEPAVQQEDLWSTFAEVEMLVKTLDRLSWICVNFMPASIEIMSPETLNFKARHLTNWFNDLLAKLHEIAAVSNQVGQQNKLMLKSMNALFRNSILICIDSEIQDPSLIAEKIGVSDKDLAPVFEAMVKEKKIKKEGKLYVRT